MKFCIFCSCILYSIKAVATEKILLLLKSLEFLHKIINYFNHVTCTSDILYCIFIDLYAVASDYNYWSHSRCKSVMSVLLSG